MHSGMFRRCRLTSNQWFKNFHDVGEISFPCLIQRGSVADAQLVRVHTSSAIIHHVLLLLQLEQVRIREGCTFSDKVAHRLRLMKCDGCVQRCSALGIVLLQIDIESRKRLEE